MMTIFSNPSFDFKMVGLLIIEVLVAYAWCLKVRASYFYRVSQAKDEIPLKILEIICAIAITVLFQVFFMPLSTIVSLLQAIASGTIFQINSQYIVTLYIALGCIYPIFTWIIICDLLIISRSLRLLKLLQDEKSGKRVPSGAKRHSEKVPPSDTEESI